MRVVVKKGYKNGCNVVLKINTVNHFLLFSHRKEIDIFKFVEKYQ